jgi:hypothetical protein
MQGVVMLSGHHVIISGRQPLPHDLSLSLSMLLALWFGFSKITTCFSGSSLLAVSALSQQQLVGIQKR